MQETMPNAELSLHADHRRAEAAEYATDPDDERWAPLHCTLFITGSALACWGILFTLAALIFG